MKKIIISAVVLIGLLWIYCITLFMLSGCSGAEGDFDNPIVVVGDTMYVKAPYFGSTHYQDAGHDAEITVKVKDDEGQEIMYWEWIDDDIKTIIIYRQGMLI